MSLQLLAARPCAARLSDGDAGAMRRDETDGTLGDEGSDESVRGAGGLRVVGPFLRRLARTRAMANRAWLLSSSAAAASVLEVAADRNEPAGKATRAEPTGRANCKLCCETVGGSQNQLQQVLAPAGPESLTSSVQFQQTN